MVWLYPFIHYSLFVAVRRSPAHCALYDSDTAESVEKEVAASEFKDKLIDYSLSILGLHGSSELSKLVKALNGLRAYVELAWVDFLFVRADVYK